MRLEIDSTGNVPLLRRTIGAFFKRYREATGEAARDGSRTGLTDVMYDWKRQAEGIAPLMYGTLRRGIRVKLSEQGNSQVGEITSSAIESLNGRSFDYGKFLDEEFPDKYGNEFMNPTTPGTVPGFINAAQETSRSKWKRILESAVKSEFKRRGI